MGEAAGGGDSGAEDCSGEMGTTRDSRGKNGKGPGGGGEDVAVSLGMDWASAALFGGGETMTTGGAAGSGSARGGTTEGGGGGATGGGDLGTGASFAVTGGSGGGMGGCVGTASAGTGRLAVFGILSVSFAGGASGFLVSAAGGDFSGTSLGEDGGGTPLAGTRTSAWHLGQRNDWPARLSETISECPEGHLIRSGMSFVPAQSGRQIPTLSVCSRLPRGSMRLNARGRAVHVLRAHVCVRETRCQSPGRRRERGRASAKSGRESGR